MKVCSITIDSVTLHGMVYTWCHLSNSPLNNESNIAMKVKMLPIIYILITFSWDFGYIETLHSLVKKFLVNTFMLHWLMKRLAINHTLFMFSSKFWSN